MDTLYIGGYFTTIDSNSVPNIAKWTGGNYVDTCGVLSSTDVKTSSENRRVSIRPNPTWKYLTFDLPEDISIRYLPIKICDLTGKLVLRQDILLQHGKTGTIDVRKLQKGVYLVKIQGVDMPLYARFVKSE